MRLCFTRLVKFILLRCGILDAFLDVNSYQALIYSLASTFILFSICKVRLKMPGSVLSRKKVSCKFIWCCTRKRRESRFLYWFQKYKTDGNTLSFLVCFMPLENTTPHGTEFAGSLCVDKWSGCYLLNMIYCLLCLWKGNFFAFRERDLTKGAEWDVIRRTCSWLPT